MDKIISATAAKRNFSKLLRAVREGQSYVVTSRGKPVAKIVPTGAYAGSEDRCRIALLTRLRSEPVVDIGRWSRNELYEGAR
jgi:prevent-host-death family protein